MTPSARLEEARGLLGASERDLLALDILAADVRAPVEIALFLAQQSLEKSIKAVLAARGVVHRRTHDLILLESLLPDNGSPVPVAHELLVRLGPYAVEFRYLGATAPVVSMAEARAAAAAALRWGAAEVGSAG